MKDIKNWIIVFLLIGFVIFGYTTLTRDNTDYKSKIEALHNANSLLEKQRHLVDLEIDSLKVEYINLQKKDSIQTINIAKRDLQIATLISNSKKSKAELDKIKAEMEETRKKIADLKSHPSNREDEDLINSLKIKTQ